MLVWAQPAHICGSMIKSTAFVQCFRCTLNLKMYTGTCTQYRHPFYMSLQSRNHLLVPNLRSFTNIHTVVRQKLAFGIIFTLNWTRSRITLHINLIQNIQSWIGLFFQRSNPEPGQMDQREAIWLELHKGSRNTIWGLAFPVETRFKGSRSIKMTPIRLRTTTVRHCLRLNYSNKKHV
jgi:hypothetical protein